MLECIAGQLSIDLECTGMHPVDGKVSVYNSAVATFFSPSDPSSVCLLHRSGCITWLL
jgi:hypothetical protein